MADSTPTPAPVQLPEFRLSISGSLPGEQAIAAGFHYAEVVRESMSQANRDRIDNLLISSWERWDTLWTRMLERLKFLEVK